MAKNAHAIERLRRLFTAVSGLPVPASTPDFRYQKNRFVPAAGRAAARISRIRPQRELEDETLARGVLGGPAREVGPRGVQRVLPSGNERRGKGETARRPPRVARYCRVSRCRKWVMYLERARACVCMDTGLSHLVAALNVPSITLYGSTDSGLIGASGASQVHLLSNLDCSPCQQKTCRYSAGTIPACSKSRGPGVRRAAAPAGHREYNFRRARGAPGRGAVSGQRKRFRHAPEGKAPSPSWNCALPQPEASRVSLSVIVIARNEAGVIRRCLESVAWADEIVVLDSGSTDATVEISRQCGARVAAGTDWQGFGVQKNRVLALATGDWVLSLDAGRVGDAGTASRDPGRARFARRAQRLPYAEAVELLRAFHAPLGLVAGLRDAAVSPRGGRASRTTSCTRADRRWRGRLVAGAPLMHVSYRVHRAGALQGGRLRERGRTHGAPARRRREPGRRGAARAVDLYRTDIPACRFPRRPRRIHARGLECRSHVLTAR